jgi:peptidoglycan/LPS O-acetylase OafA/YrhL
VSDPDSSAAPAPVDRSGPLPYLPQLDGLRAVAVALVIAVHDYRITGGYLGVDVFFVLSGYLITSVLLADRDRGNWSLRSFYARRFLRLSPALLVMLVLLVPFGRHLSGNGTLSGYLGSALASGTYVSDFLTAANPVYPGALSHTWSLAIEEQFYLLWPVALLALLQSGLRPRAMCVRVGLVAFAMLAVLVAASVPRGASGAPAVYYLPVTRGGVIVLGCLLALVLRERRIRSARAATGLTLASALVLAAAVAAAPDTFERAAGLAVLVAGLASAGLIAGLVSAAGSVVARLLGAAPIAYLGRISYGIYLWHLPIFWGIPPRPFLGTERASTSVLKLALTVTAAVLSFHFVERPFLKLKSRLRRDAAQPLVPAAEAEPLSEAG